MSILLADGADPNAQVAEHIYIYPVGQGKKSSSPTSESFVYCF